MTKPLGNKRLKAPTGKRLMTGAWLCLALLCASPLWALTLQPGRPLNMVPDALIEPGPGPNRYMFVVEKATQTFNIFEFKNGDYYFVKSYKCTTGENIGDKMVEGDKKTPEGFYLFNKKSLESELAPIYGVLAYPMDYPNFWDRRLGKSGMGIWLHGTNRPRVDRDSNGCIALDNVDLIEIEPLINLYDSPIIVYDRINYLPVEEVNADAARVKAFVESWRRAWENKDFQAYQSKYARDFVNNDSKSFDAWMAHKKRLNKKYETIQVDLSDFRIFKHQDMITVTFKQHYRGNNTFDSRGVKRLYIRENPGNQYEIAAEVWRPAPPRPKVRYLSAEVKNRVLAQGRLTEKTVASAAAAKTAAKPAAAKTPAAKPYQTAKIEANKPKPPKAAPRTPPVQTQTAALIQNRPEENRPPKAPEPTPAPATKQAPVKAKQPEATAPAVNPRRKIRRTIREWLDAWRSKNLDEYLAHYHPAFQYKDMDLAGFREYKEELNAKYDQIDIKIDKMDIQVDGAKAKVTFIQDYRSDQYQDYGMKTLVLRKTNNQWKIQEETWQDISAGAKP